MIILWGSNFTAVVDIAKVGVRVTFFCFLRKGTGAFIQ